MDELKTIGIQALLEIWSRRKWLAIIVFLCPATLFTTVALSLPNLYKATAKVLIARQEVSEAFVRSSVTGELETRLHAIGQEILSRGPLLDLMHRFDLYPKMRKQLPLEAVIAQMRRDISIEHDRTELMYGRGPTIAFSLSFRGTDPILVAQVANMLASLYVQQNLKSRERQATETAEFLDAQLDELKKKLDEEERRMSAFKKEYLGELPEQLEVNLATLERLNMELRLNKETQMRVLEQMEMEALRRQLTEAVTPHSTLPSTLSENEGERLLVRLSKLKRELTELRSRFSDKYPDVVRLKAEIAAVEKELAEQQDQEGIDASAPVTAPKRLAQRKTPRSDTEATLDRLKEEEQKLRHAIALYQHRVENAPRREQEFKELTRDYNAMKEHYQTLVKRYEDAKLAESMEQKQKAEQFRILEHAMPPTMPMAPKRLKLIIFGILLSLALAAGAVVLAEFYDASFHSLEELRAFTKVPVLVSIPRLVTAAEERRKRWVVRATAVAATLGLTFIVAGSYKLSHGNEALARMVAWGSS